MQNVRTRKNEGIHMNIKQETLKTIIKNCVELIMIFAVGAITYGIMMLITGDVNTSLIIMNISVAQFIICTKITDLETKLAPKIAITVKPSPA